MGDCPTSIQLLNEAIIVDLFKELLEQAPCPMALLSGRPPSILSTNEAFSLLFAECSPHLNSTPFCSILCDPLSGLQRIEEAMGDGSPTVFHEQRSHQSRTTVFTYALWKLRLDFLPFGMMVQVKVAEIDEKAVAMNEALLIRSLRHQGITEQTQALNTLLHAEITEREQVASRLRELQMQLSLKAGQLESLVTERTKELTEINKELEYFVYAIAHDLRAPLRAVQGFASVLTKEAGANLSERGNYCATRIDKAARFMDALLIDLLTFSQISKQRPELSQVKLKPMVESVLARLLGEIENKDVQETHSGPWPDVWAHETILHQVIYNLASNALKFSKPDVPPLLRLFTETHPGVVRIWIEDNGIGIAPAHQTQIFLPFMRLNGDRYSGTGIGLAIVQKGMERMGGRVGLESSLGEGSRFWIELKTVSNSAHEVSKFNLASDSKNTSR